MSNTRTRAWRHRTNFLRAVWAIVFLFVFLVFSTQFVDNLDDPSQNDGVTFFLVLALAVSFLGALFGPSIPALLGLRPKQRSERSRTH